MRRFNLIFALCLCGTTALAEPYANPRYGFSIDAPAQANQRVGPANGDGAVFDLNGPQSTLTVSGAFDLYDDIRLDQDLLRHALFRSENLVTYDARGDGWYVLSGIAMDSRIFYLRKQMGFDCNGTAILITMQFDYVTEDAAVIEPLIGPTARSIDTQRCP